MSCCNPVGHPLRHSIDLGRIMEPSVRPAADGATAFVTVEYNIELLVLVVEISNAFQRNPPKQKGTRFARSLTSHARTTKSFSTVRALLLFVERQLYRSFSFFFTDASQYAHYVFKTFKNGNETGTINFEVLIIIIIIPPVINVVFYTPQIDRWMTTRKTRISNYMCVPIQAIFEPERRMQ